MAKIVAISGADTQTPTGLAWFGIIGVTALIVVGTLMIRSDKKESSP